MPIEFLKAVIFGSILAFCGFLAILIGIEFFLSNHLFFGALSLTVGYTLLTFKIKYSYDVNFDFSEKEDDSDE